MFDAQKYYDSFRFLQKRLKWSNCYLEGNPISFPMLSWNRNIQQPKWSNTLAQFSRRIKINSVQLGTSEKKLCCG